MQLKSSKNGRSRLSGYLLPLALTFQYLPASARAENDAGHEVWQTHASHAGFAAGTLGNSGENLYVSASGAIQMINRWDLNNDGYLDLLIGQSHATLEMPDLLIYWGTRNGPESIMPPIPEHQPLARLLRQIELRKNNVTRLPAEGGGRCLLVDLNNDARKDIVLCNWIHNFSVHADAFIYWAGAEGFDPRRLTRLPTLGGTAVAAADFNRDGFVDLVFANRGHELGESFGFSHHLESYIYWNGPTGFSDTRRTSLPTISAVNCVAGDLNRDDYTDLVFLNNNSRHKSVYVYWNGVQGFSPERRAVWEGGHPVGVHIDDLNADGSADLVIMHSDNRAELRQSTGNGLEQKAWCELPTLAAEACVSADLDQDGFLDLVFANRHADGQGHWAAWIYWGNEDGFASVRRTELPTMDSPSVTAADFDGNGWPDLAFANHRNEHTSDVNSYIYWNGPEGFDPAHRRDLQGFGAISTAAADLNDDGNQDLVLVNSNSSGRNTLGDEVTSPGTLIYWGNARHHYSTAAMSWLPTTGDAMAAGDVNDDGFVDIIYPQGILHHGGPDGFAAEHSDILDVPKGHGVTLADLNRDGYLDAVMPGGLDATQQATTPNETDLPPKGDAAVEEDSPEKKLPQSAGIILWGNAQGFSRRHMTVLPMAVRYGQTAAVADLDQDGCLDLIFPDVMSSNLVFFWGSTDGTYDTGRQTVMQVHSASTVEIADLNADGWLDLIMGGNYDETDGGRHMQHVTLLYGGPDGYDLSRSTRIEGCESSEQAVADLNRDGHLDIVMSGYHGDSTRTVPSFIYWGNSEGNFSNSRRSAFPMESPLAVTVLDLNQDHWLDILINTHQERGDHCVGSSILWGSPEGYDFGRRHWIQTFGTHFSTRRDLGDVYRRRLEEEYVSPGMEALRGRTPSRIRWQAETPHGTTVAFQIRSAPIKSELTATPWCGPEGVGSFYQSSGAELSIPAHHRWLQYRAILATPDGGSTPVIRKVVLEVRQQ